MPRIYFCCPATTGTQRAASQSELSSVADCRSSPQISSHTATVQPQDHLRGTRAQALTTACLLVYKQQHHTTPMVDYTEVYCVVVLTNTTLHAKLQSQFIVLEMSSIQDCACLSSPM